MRKYILNIYTFSLLISPRWKRKGIYIQYVFSNCNVFENGHIYIYIYISIKKYMYVNKL